jgi:hypothetical protein
LNSSRKQVSCYVQVSARARGLSRRVGHRFLRFWRKIILPPHPPGKRDSGRGKKNRFHFSPACEKKGAAMEFAIPLWGGRTA